MEKKVRISISNMHCSNCSMAVEKHFNQYEDIKVNVILSENEGLFTYDDATWDERKIEKHLNIHPPPDGGGCFANKKSAPRRARIKYFIKDISNQAETAR